YDPLRRLVLERCDLKWGWPSRHLLPAPPTTATTEAYDEDFDLVRTMLPTPRGDLVHERLVGRRGQPGMTRRHWLAGRDDALKYLSIPLPQPEGDVGGLLTLEDEVGDRGIVEVRAPWLNPAGSAAELFGSETFAALSIEDRGLLLEVVEHETQKLLRVVDYLLTREAVPFFAIAGQEYVAPPLHGPRDFWDFNVAFDRRVFARIRDAGGLVHVHCHGRVGRVLDGFIEAGVNCLHPLEAPPMGDVTAAEANAVLGGTVCMEGNIQVGDLFSCERAEIERQVVQLTRDAGPTGLIVAPTASPYQPVCPERTRRNYEAMILTALAAR
ncbi:MAG: uroporphyrinogen decarboxylase family protein, partial [Planctomycetota bacterium]